MNNKEYETLCRRFDRLQEIFCRGEHSNAELAEIKAEMKEIERMLDANKRDV